MGTDPALRRETWVVSFGMEDDVDTAQLAELNARIASLRGDVSTPEEERRVALLHHQRDMSATPPSSKGRSPAANVTTVPSSASAPRSASVRTAKKG